MSLLPVGIGPQEGGYQIERSLRFNSADSAYLSRTPASAGNRKTWTWSGWVKRSTLDSNMQALFGCIDSGAAYYTNLVFDNTTPNTLVLYDNLVGGSTVVLRTTQLFRDVSAWYHIVLAYDTTQATAANRVKLYVNGSQITAFSTDARSSLTQNADGSVNRANQHGIGTRQPYQGNYFNGYLTEINFIDGQALDPTSFGEYNSETGVWQPIRYSGSYGTNGFYLDFADNSSTSALGYDAAGSNDWTPNNFSVTAGAGNDSLVDTPTNYGTDTGVGGEVRGNYATLNPLDKNSAVTTVNGNLQYTSSNDRIVKATFGVTSGKWYWEFSPGGGGSTSGCGVINPSVNIHATVNLNIATAGVSYLGNGNKSVNGTASSYGATYTSGDVIGVALDLTANTVTYYKNNSSQGAISLTSGLEWFPAFDQNTGTNTANFGQRPFAYTAPSGFKALCTQNLPEPTVVDGSQYFDATTYTGNGTAGRVITVSDIDNVGLAWVKIRSGADDHRIANVVTGGNKHLKSNATDAESTGTNIIQAFSGNTFTVGSDLGVNSSGSTYVAWTWAANGAGVSNTAGTITSTVSANTTAGFSIVTYTGNGTAGATIGHGIGIAPSMIIVKRRDGGSGYSWHVQHVSTGNTRALFLDSTSAGGTSNVYWNSTSPTSTVYTAGSDTSINASGGTFVAYCFAPVAGYSAFGSFSTNGSADGPFIYTGFTPRWILMKYSNTTSYWLVMDTARNTYNVVTQGLRPNTSDADSTALFAIDILSNGFKPRDGGGLNGAGNTTIYAAFAESPFKYSLGR